MFDPEEIEEVLKRGEARLTNAIADRFIKATYSAYMRELTQVVPSKLSADECIEIVCAACQAVALIMVSTLRSCAHPHDKDHQEQVFNLGCAVLFQELHVAFAASYDPDKHQMIKGVTKQ